MCYSDNKYAFLRLIRISLLDIFWPYANITDLFATINSSHGIDITLYIFISQEDIEGHVLHVMH